MINERQAQLLSYIVQEVSDSAQPVASKTMVEKYQLGVSPATVRNDMAVLEAVGLLRQPHTSSGRVPTEDGYRFYLEHFVNEKCSQKVRPPLQEAMLDVKDTQQKLRKIAKALVDISGETAISSLDAKWNHYAGIQNLFDKPDFHDISTLRALSAIVDKFDDVLRGMFDQVDNNVNIWIGDEGPFGDQVATMMVKYQLPNGMTGLLGLVGPMRMNYKQNIQLLTEAKQLLDG
jgi:heat-inducible transcriptional repressor